MHQAMQQSAAVNGRGIQRETRPPAMCVAPAPSAASTLRAAHVTDVRAQRSTTAEPTRTSVRLTRPMAAAHADSERLRFERAVLPWLGSLRGLALRLSRSRAEADDLVQETVLRAWRFWPRYTERDSCRAWLQRILSNTFVSAKRRSARERGMLALAEHTFRAEPQPLAASVPDGGLDDEMAGGLAALGADQRSVLWLVDVQDRSYREAAAELGWPIGTVMSRLHRARNAMRKQLEAALAPAPTLDAAL
jgi:RNA polymerase sigma-70 factor, ECF subfamily